MAHLEILLTFLIYFVIIFGIGFSASRRINNASDFVLGGRHLKGAVAALGVGASDMSGWLLLGLPGAVYLNGINQIWISVGLSIGAFLNWHLIAARLRIYTEKAKDALTIPTFLENRFEDKTGLLRIVSAAMILFFYTIYASAGFVSGALLFETIFPLDYQHALLMGAIIIAAYTCIGGFLAVNWVDFFQGSLMFVALITVPIVAFFHVGSWHEVFARVNEVHAGINDAFYNITLMGILSLMAWGLGYMGQPHILARFMAVTTVRELPKARFICMTWMIVSLYGATFTGFLGIAYFNQQPLSEPEQVFIHFAMILFNPWVAGCLLAAVLSAIMSTIAAQLLSSSSSLVEDFYRRFFRKNAGAKELVWMNRLMVAVITVCAVLLSFDPKSRVLDLVSYGWAGLGATFGPVLIFALFWARTNRFGVVSGMLSGGITVVIWHLCASLGGVFEIYDILPGFIMGCLGVFIGSYFGKPVTKAIVKRHHEISSIMHHELYQQKDIA
ncbi:MAG: putP [Gammaproteobacteria bacterium]|nr:putP [Gammaproteobacteria bacterium]